LVQKIKANCPALPTNIGHKLFKFKLKLIRQDSRVKNQVVGYSFGDSEVLLEITPTKEVQISIESETPNKVAKIFNFSTAANVAD
jgi:hypothetical protein